MPFDIPTFLHNSPFVQPVAPGLMAMPTMQRIVTYLSREPAKSAKEIAAALALSVPAARTALYKLALSGEVRKMDKPHGNATVRYELGEDESYLKRGGGWKATHATVKQWEPETRRDELVAALFGKP